MKKNILAAITVLITICTINAQETKEATAFENSYKAFIASESYLDFEKSVEEFRITAKHNSYETSLAYESEFLKNLEEKITTTNFKNYEEAKKAYDDVKKKYSIMKSSNEAFFTLLKESKQWSLANLMAVKLQEPQDEKCKVCWKSTNGSLKSIAFKYESTLRYKDNSAVTSYMTYKNTIPLLERSYKYCIEGCENQ